MDWIQTVSGRKFFPLDPRPEDICIEDIARALSNTCRFTGHCRFYSVAQHSVLVSMRVPEEAAAWGLLHDSAEAYLNDVARPIKGNVFFSAPEGFIPYKVVETRVLKAIAEAFHLDWPIPGSIKEVDDRMLLTEQRDLLGPQIEPWNVPATPYEDLVLLDPWSPATAERFFLQRFHALGLHEVSC